jgi:SAM-dependent methyltransferase
MGRVEPTDVERALEAAILDRLALHARPDLAIHPEDEMYTWLSRVGVDPARRRAYYVREGHEALVLLEHLAACAGRRLDELGDVLEFASGYGRTTRFLVAALPPGRLFCSDVLPGAVAFAGQRFGAQAFLSATDPGDLAPPGPDRRFGLIFAGSLFTHLPRRRFGPWLRRLYDLLAPDGILAFSTQGPHACREPEQDPGGYTFLPKSESASLSTSEYGATWVAEDVVRAIAAEAGVGTLAYAPFALWSSQDVYVASPSGPPAWTGTPRVHGAFVDVRVAPNGHAWIGGWTRTRAVDGPPEEVRLELDAPEGRRVFPALLGPPVRWGPGDAFLHTEWYLEGDTSMLPAGVHPLCAVAQLASGRATCFDVAPIELG